MKKCTHCGTSVKGSAASFCTKCKKPLKSNINTQRSAPEKPTKTRPVVKQASPPPAKKRTLFPVKPKQAKRKKPDSIRKPVKNPMDENYDGYYDDRLPDDSEHMKETESTNPEILKQAALIAGGAFLFIIIAVVIMFLL